MGTLEPPNCPRAEGLNDWKSIPATTYQEAPVPDRVGRAVPTEDLYVVIAEARSATNKYNKETLPNIRKAGEKQDEKVEEYNSKIKRQNATCDSIIEKWIKKYNPERSKLDKLLGPL